MTMAEFVREQGRAEGEEQGLRRALISNLEFKFGPLPTFALTAIQRANDDELLAWHRQTLVAEQLSDLGMTA